MTIIKFILYSLILTSISSCMISFPENKINIAHASVTEESVCRLRRLDTYSLPSLPDVAGLGMSADDEVIMLSMLVEHIGSLRKDIIALKEKECVN